MTGLTRREFLKCAGVAGAAFLTGSPVGDLEKAFSEQTKTFNLKASVEMVDLGHRHPFKAWTYNGTIPGPEIRVKEGQNLRVVLENRLPEETTIHWHGVPVPNRMDGVPFVTQRPIQPGESFVYEFRAAPPGTYIYHTHVSYQLDRGLYGALIIEPIRQERPFDREYVLMLEDWAVVDGGGPEASRRGRTHPSPVMMGRMGMGGMGRTDMMRNRLPGASTPLYEPLYDAFAVNGKIFEASDPFTVTKGDRVRFRIINPSSATIYTVRISGHPMTITHSDGRPVVPYPVDALRIGMGERYDVEVHANRPGRWRIYNLRDGSPAGGWPLGTLLYRGIRAKGYDEDDRPGPAINDYRLLEGLEDGSVRPILEVDRVFRMVLSGGMMGSPYWTINGRIYPDSDDVLVKRGERIRLEYLNRSMMDHPMHLHGHFFELNGTGRFTGLRVRKDTLLIPAAMGSGAVEFTADNPGSWLHHCHNLYHMEAGMANIVTVR